MILKSILPAGAAAFAASAALALASCGGSADSTSPSSAGADDYPLTTCVVSGEDLGSMGDPVKVEHEGVTVQLCCDHCLPKFNEDPAKYAAMVN